MFCFSLTATQIVAVFCFFKQIMLLFNYWCINACDLISHTIDLLQNTSWLMFRKLELLNDFFPNMYSLCYNICFKTWNTTTVVVIMFMYIWNLCWSPIKVITGHMNEHADIWKIMSFLLLDQLIDRTLSL